jgi:hypothetical protein
VLDLVLSIGVLEATAVLDALMLSRLAVELGADRTC